MTSKLVLVALLAIFVLATNVDEAQAGWRPAFWCNALKNRFLLLGCLDKVSLRCNILYRRITFRLLLIPACDFVACVGYGNALGDCTSRFECGRVNDNGICPTGQVCCEQLSTTTTTTTTTTRPGGGGGGGGSSSGGGGGSSLVDNDVGNMFERDIMMDEEEMENMKF